METYFVTGKRPEAVSGFVRQPSQNSSLAAVVYTMVQARRKQTVKRSNQSRKFFLFVCSRLSSTFIDRYFVNTRPFPPVETQIVFILDEFFFPEAGGKMNRTRSQQKKQGTDSFGLENALRLTKFSSMRVTNKDSSLLNSHRRHNTTKILELDRLVEIEQVEMVQFLVNEHLLNSNLLFQSGEGTEANVSGSKHAPKQREHPTNYTKQSLLLSAANTTSGKRRN